MEKSQAVASTDSPVHKVVLIKADNVYLARPSYPIVSKGNRVRFLNYSGTTITLTFLDSKPFGIATLALQPNERSEPLLVEQQHPNGAYRYDGVTAENAVLRGDSSPHIIIDD